MVHSAFGGRRRAFLSSHGRVALLTMSLQRERDRVLVLNRRVGRVGNNATGAALGHIPRKIGDWSEGLNQEDTTSSQTFKLAHAPKVKQQARKKVLRGRPQRHNAPNVKLVFQRYRGSESRTTFQHALTSATSKALGLGFGEDLRVANARRATHTTHTQNTTQRNKHRHEQTRNTPSN